MIEIRRVRTKDHKNRIDRCCGRMERHIDMLKLRCIRFERRGDPDDHGDHDDTFDRSKEDKIRN